MTSQYRHRRTSAPATAFPNPLEPGEIAVNTANRQLAVGDAASGAVGVPLPLLAVRFFDQRAIYAANDLVIGSGGILYRAKHSNGPGVFNPADWFAGATQLIVADTPPPGVLPGSLWWESDSGILYILYDDGNSTQWVIASPQPDISLFVQRAGDTMTGPLNVLAKVSVGGATDLVPAATSGLSINAVSAPGGLLAVGQDTNHHIEFLWNYNDTPANATGAIATFGYLNNLGIDAKVLILQGASAGVTNIGGSLNVGGIAQFGGGANILNYASPGAGFWYASSTTVNRWFVGSDLVSDLWRVYCSGVGGNALAINGATGAVQVTYNLTVNGPASVGGDLSIAPGAAVARINFGNAGSGIYWDGTNYQLSGPIYNAASAANHLYVGGAVFTGYGNTNIGSYYFGQDGTRRIYSDGLDFAFSGGSLRSALKSPITFPGYSTNDWTAAFHAMAPSSWAFMEDQGSGGSGGLPGTWWFNTNMRHQNPGTYYGLQQAWGWNDNANEFYSRDWEGGTPGPWVRFLNSNNIGSYAVTLASGDARYAKTPHCGRLAAVAGNQLLFSPYNGDDLKINGVFYHIPPAGISIANTGAWVDAVVGQNLAANTLYYLFLTISGGVPTPYFAHSVTHTTSVLAGNVGVEIAGNGDNNFTLIGMVYTNASGQFTDACTLSWFNKRPRAFVTGVDNAGTTSTTPGKLGSQSLDICSWASEATNATLLSQCAVNAGYAVMTVAYDTPASYFVNQTIVYMPQTSPYPGGGTGVVAEGKHNWMIAGYVGTAANLNCLNQMLQVVIRG